MARVKIQVLNIVYAFKRVNDAISYLNAAIICNGAKKIEVKLLMRAQARVEREEVRSF